jgi:retinol dehydrogenase-12
VPPSELEGRVAIVTGATSGIGLEVARGLAGRGFRTVVVGRGTGRVRSTAAALVAQTGNPKVDAVAVGDLGVRSETHALGLELLQRYPKIHVLVNNAGAYYRRREASPDGTERTFALNVLAPLSLILDLAPALRAAAPSRVVNVASAAHFGERVDLTDLENRNRYRGFRQYGRSKLELILLTRELARRFSGSGVSVLSVHPGFVASGFGQNNGGGTRLLLWASTRLFGRSLRRGAVTPLLAATDPRFDGISGVYVSGGEVRPGSVASRDMGMAGRLFDRCLTYLPDIPRLAEPPALGPSRSGADAPT